MMLQILLWLDIAFTVLFILLCVVIAVRTRVWQTVPIALAGVALLLQYVFTVAQLPGWMANAELRMYWARFFYGVFIFSICVHLLIILRQWRRHP